MDWLTIIVFSVVFHATGQLMSAIKAYQDRRIVDSLLRDIRSLEKTFDDTGKIKRVK
jgi:hypothetical protein